MTQSERSQKNWIPEALKTPFFTVAVIAISLLLFALVFVVVNKHLFGWGDQSLEATQQFQKENKTRPEDFERLILDYEKCEKVTIGAGYFLEGDVLNGSVTPTQDRDAWYEVVAYLADRGDKKARKDLTAAVVTDESESNPPRTLEAELLDRKCKTLREAWNQLRQQPHHYDGNYTKIVVEKAR